MPDSDNAETVDVRRELVIANRILANQGVLDAFGHISVRSPSDPSTFFIARSLGPEMVTEVDVQQFDFDGREVNGDTRQAYAERAIHAAVYAARPDVQSVCHNHAPSIIPFGVAGRAPRPIYHMAVLLGSSVPIWDMRDDFGDTDLLVRRPDQGRSLARALGSNNVALMRGHGAVVAGRTIRETVFNCIFMEQNARITLQALALSAEPTFLSDGEIALAQQAQTQPFVLKRAWDTWKARVGFPDEP